MPPADGDTQVPPLVTAARQRAQQIDFEFSCDDGTGRLLAVLGAAVPEHGRILELGTGVGMGIAWFLHGLGPRTDVEIHSVELHQLTATVAAQEDWPDHVHLHVGDALALLPTLGSFDLIFADAPGGKWTGLDQTIAALKPGGVLIVDDMIPKADFPPERLEAHEGTRANLFADPDLIAVEIADLTGVILATKRRGPA